MISNLCVTATTTLSYLALLFQTADLATQSRAEPSQPQQLKLFPSQEMAAKILQLEPPLQSQEPRNPGLYPEEVGPASPGLTRPEQFDQGARSRESMENLLQTSSATSG